MRHIQYQGGTRPFSIIVSPGINIIFIAKLAISIAKKREELMEKQKVDVETRNRL